jgi:hypothetical protein
MERTNPHQFEVTILGVRRPSLGEVFEIEIPPRRQRIEVECVDRLEGVGERMVLVERTDDGPVPQGEVQSRVISDVNSPPDLTSGHAHHDHLVAKGLEQDLQDTMDGLGDDWHDILNNLDNPDEGPFEGEESFDDDW